MKFNYNQSCILNDILKLDDILSKDACVIELKKLEINCENDLKHDLKMLIKVVSNYSQCEFEKLLRQSPLNEDNF